MLCGCSSSMSEMARARLRGSPASTPSASPRLTGKQQLSGNDQPLNLAGALADGGELDVAEVLLGRIVFDETVSTVNLDAVFGRTNGDFARVQLGHRRFERRALPGILHRGGAIGQQPCSLDSRRI